MNGIREGYGVATTGVYGYMYIIIYEMLSKKKIISAKISVLGGAFPSDCALSATDGILSKYRPILNL